jgi:hypothetical protein
MKKFLTGLRTTAWRTAGARYNASRRLRQRESFSTISLALFSSLSIAVTFAQRIYSPASGSPLDNYLTALLASLGVFLLAISLLEWGAAHGARADALHRNAEELTAYQLKLAQVLEQLDITGTIEDSRVDELRLEYEAIKDRCAYNHETSDDRLFRAQQRRAPEMTISYSMGLLQAWWIMIRWQVSTVWYFGLFWFTICGAVAYAWYVPKV